MRIFLSTSFSSQVLPDGTVKPAYRTELEAIIESLEKAGHSVFCALREDNWKLNDITPGKAFLMDANAVTSCDMLIALIRNNPPSAGIQFELGVAHALHKRIILLWQATDQPLQYINQGLLETPNTTGTAYQTPSDIPNLLKPLL